MLVYSNLTWMGFGIDRWLQTLESRKYDAMLAGLWAMVRSETLSLPVHSSHSLDCFGAALSADAAPTREGKVLIAQQH
jgi:hypothetical protein